MTHVIIFIFSSVCCVFFARPMHYTSKFVMTVLSKCVANLWRVVFDNCVVTKRGPRGREAQEASAQECATKRKNPTHNDVAKNPTYSCGEYLNIGFVEINDRRAKVMACSEYVRQEMLLSHPSGVRTTPTYAAMSMSYLLWSVVRHVCLAIANKWHAIRHLVQNRKRDQGQFVNILLANIWDDTRASCNRKIWKLAWQVQVSHIVVINIYICDFFFRFDNTMCVWLFAWLGDTRFVVCVFSWFSCKTCQCFHGNESNKSDRAECTMNPHMVDTI